MLHARIADAGRSVARSAGPEEPFRSLVPDPLERVSLDAFLAAARSGLLPKPEPEVRTDHVAPIRASVRDAVETILALLPASGAVRFRDLTLGRLEKLEVIVRFLAVLELFKQGVIDIEQSESFADLIVVPLAPGERVELDLASIADLDGDERVVPDRARAAPLSGSEPMSGSETRVTDLAVDVDARAAIEAVVLAAIEPVPPAVLAQLVELPTARVEELCDELAAEYAREGRGFQLARVAGGLSLPDASRCARVRRTVRARRPDRPIVGARARDARDRRVQTADRARADLGDPWRQRRRDAEDARRSRLHRRERARAHSREPDAVLDDALVPGASRARFARTAAVAGRLRSRGRPRRGARAGPARVSTSRSTTATTVSRSTARANPPSPSGARPPTGRPNGGRAAAEAARARGASDRAARASC